MGEAVDDFSEGYTEEKTEPFSQSEIDARLNSIRVEDITTAMTSSVPLDHLVVPPDQGIRILMRPLTRSRSVSPGNPDNCEWLALRAELPIESPDQEQAQHKVLAVTQTPRDIKFIVRIPSEGRENEPPRPPLWCELYYDPASDNQILVNRTDLPINISRVANQVAPSPAVEYVINPGSTKALTPGTWRINLQRTEILDFRILEKRHMTLTLPGAFSSEAESPSLNEMVNSSGKRSFVADEDDMRKPEKKLRATGSGNDDGVIMFLRPKADPLVFPLPNAAKGQELDVVGRHPLLDLEKDEAIDIPGGCEIDEYRITKREPIASTALSAVYTAEHSKVPDGMITVKVLKTRAPTNNGAVIKPHENERNVIRQADIWLREFQSQEDLQHDGIVRLYGGDARYLSLYMEHVDAKDLASRGFWRETGTELFRGNRSDALRILRDIAGALHYIHNRGLVHNDIKPANILYSRERGAVLCDFGLSTYANNPPTTGGTPYYIPPEFIGRKLRGAPSDVWALGIVMLYVMGKITFPDARSSRAHPRPLYWMIADINRPQAYNTAQGRPAQMPALQQMQVWLMEIHETRSKLNLNDKLERLVFDMLTPQPANRLTMRKLLGELFADQGPEG